MVVLAVETGWRPAIVVAPTGRRPVHVVRVAGVVLAVPGRVEGAGLAVCAVRAPGAVPVAGVFLVAYAGLLARLPVVAAGRRLAVVCGVTGRREAHPVVTVDRPVGLAALTGRRVAVGIGLRVAVVTVLTGVLPVNVDCVTGRPVVAAGRRTVDAIAGAVVCSPEAASGRPVADVGRPVTTGGRPVTAGGRLVMDGGRPVMDGGRPVVASGRPVVVDRSAFDGTAALTGPAVSGVRAAPGAAGRPAGPMAAAGILEAGRAVGCIMT